jgi:acetyltransferase-like isoleucine patch superfamily enzyme
MSIRSSAGRVITKYVTRLRKAYWAFRLGSLGQGSNIYPAVQIYTPSHVRIGNNVTINSFVHIWGTGGVEIGDDSLIAAHTVITSQSHSASALADGKLYRETLDLAPVKIGRNVWIGSNVTILPGIEIGDNAVIAAGAVVARSVLSDTLVAGVPAGFKRSLSKPS